MKAKAALDILSVFLLIVCLTQLPCCTRLPDASGLFQDLQYPSSSPAIKGCEGRLSSPAVAALINRLEQESGPTDILGEQLVAIESLSGNPLIAGNKVELLIDGQKAFAVMFDDIQNAKNHINIETYSIADDTIGRRFSDLLIQRRMSGVRVNFIYDSCGCSETPSAFFKKLEMAGIRTLEFNPTRQSVSFQRNHSKLLIVDGRIAITGGINISEKYVTNCSGPEKRKRRRDTNIRITGPAVAELQRQFLSTWKETIGEAPEGNLFPTPSCVGTDLVRVVASTPGRENRIPYLTYLYAIRNASYSIHLTHSFFAPDEQILDALRQAAKGGVDVKIILPYKGISRMVQDAGRFHYTSLLSSGVKIYERQNKVLHAKTAVIDGIWSTVGSTNLDNWSLLRNNEVNTVILSRDFAREMETMFAEDLARSREVLLEEWQSRPFFWRINQWLANLFRYWL